MRVKRFVAPTIQAAMAMVRDQLGPDAVILHTRKQPRRGIFRLLRRPRYEVLAAVETRRPNGAEYSPPLVARSSMADRLTVPFEEPQSALVQDQPMTEALSRMMDHLRSQAVPDDLIQTLAAGVRAKAELPQDLETPAWEVLIEDQTTDDGVTRDA